MEKKLDKNYVVGAILMDLCKAFDCVPHDLVIAKLHAYGFDLKSLEYILSYLTNRKQSTRINEIYSLFEIILSGVPQGSILGPIIFNIFLNDLFFFIENNGIHNYADDNTLSSFSNSFPNLIKILENQSNIALSWLQNNKMMANPKKFHAILLSKIKSDNSDFEIKIGNRTIRPERTVKLLGVTLDDKLNFDLHVSKICKTASTQLNALYRFKSILHLQAKRVLVQSFVYANFNYCPLVWHFSSAKSLLKVEKIHERAVRFLYNSDKISCENLSVKSPSNNDMCVLRLRNLCIEIFKTINEMSPTYMKEIFLLEQSSRPVRKLNYNNLRTASVKTNTFGTKSLGSLGPKVWNNLPCHIKSTESLMAFKKMIKTWDGNKCLRKKCKKKEDFQF